MTTLVKKYNLNSSIVDLSEILPILQKAQKNYGIHNVQLRLESKRDSWGQDRQSITVCCYKE